MLKGVHHINLLVQDLDVAVSRYQALLGIDNFEYGELQNRGVRTARFKVGETWLVLVQPLDPRSEPGRYLAEHGEGLFLLSLEVESLDGAIREVANRGGQYTASGPREGLDGWKVVDLEIDQFFGAQLQLVEPN